LDVKNGDLITKLPADEVAKPLKRIVLDLATKATRVNRLMKTSDMLDYLRKDLGKERGAEPRIERSETVRPNPALICGR
jgi:hypothetical protein